MCQAKVKARGVEEAADTAPLVAPKAKAKAKADPDDNKPTAQLAAPKKLKLKPKRKRLQIRRSEPCRRLRERMSSLSLH